MPEVQLSEACNQLKEVTGRPDLDFTYQEIWRGIVNGRIRATKRRGRWLVDPALLAADLGLSVKTI